MDLTLLRASDGTALTKKFTKLDDGSLEKESFPAPHTWDNCFTSQSHQVTSLPSLLELLEQVDHDTCLLKGNVTRPLVAERRAGSTKPNEATEWLCLDVDGLPVNNADEFMDLIGYGDVSYVEQLSCSAGIDLGRGYSAHIFVFIKEPAKPKDIKVWLQQLNLELLRDHVTLNKGGFALKWPLDISTCQNDKLLYVAPPVCVGFDAPDTPRLRYVRKKHQRLTIDFAKVDKLAIDTDRRRYIKELRSAAGLRKKSFKMDGDTLLNPDKVEIAADYKIGEDFVHFNINGGDSFGYYFPVNNPEIVYNFKGEPNVRLKDIDEEFYNSYKALLAAKNGEAVADDEEAPALQYFIGDDMVSDRLIRGTFDAEKNEVEYYFTRSRQSAIDFMKSHGQPKPDIIFPWRTYIDFKTLGPVVDMEARTLNRFKPSKYMRAADTEPVSINTVPATILSILNHVMNGDEATIEHFLNWVACVMQYRKQTLTAWVFTGTQGTGKGILFDLILTPIFGEAHCGKANFAAFDEKFNKFMKDRLLLFIDEVHASSDKLMNKAMDSLKQSIASPVIPIREMRTDLVDYPNHANFIFASNRVDSVAIPNEDRRFNIAPRQETPLKDVMALDGIDEKIESELQAFAHYLMTREASMSTALEILDNSERQRLIATTANPTQEVARRIKLGDFDWILAQLGDQLDDNNNRFQLSTKIKKQITLRQVLGRLFDHDGGACNLARDDVALLFYHMTDTSIPGPTKFRQFLERLGLQTEDRIRCGGEHQEIGIRINKVTVNHPEAWLRLQDTKLRDVA